jgi:hypothetical protein
MFTRALSGVKKAYRFLLRRSSAVKIDHKAEAKTHAGADGVRRSLLNSCLGTLQKIQDRES